MYSTPVDGHTLFLTVSYYKQSCCGHTVTSLGKDAYLSSPWVHIYKYIYKYMAVFGFVFKDIILF